MVSCLKVCCSSHLKKKLKKISFHPQPPSRVLFVVQLQSCVWLFMTPWTATCQASLSFNTSWSFLKSMSIELVMLSNYWSSALLSPSIFSSIRVFYDELTLRIRWSFFCFIGYTKAFDWIPTNYGNSWRNGNTRLPYLSPERFVWGSKSNS